MSPRSEVFKRFIAECTVESPGDRIQASMLARAYNAWAAPLGFSPLSKVAIAKEMKALSKERKKNSASYWLDLKLASDADPQSDAGQSMQQLETAWRSVPPPIALRFLLGKLRALGLK